MPDRRLPLSRPSTRPWPISATSTRGRSSCGSGRLEDRRAQEATAVYVSLGDEAEAAVGALALAAANRSGATPVLAAKHAESGAAVLMGGRVAVFGVLTRALAADFIFRGLNETMARAMHASYRRSQEEVDPDNPSLVDWNELPESLKDSNRRFADSIGPKLEVLGCVAVPAPLAELDGNPSPLESDEIERLARIEHDRWAADLIRDGWTHGETKDPAAKRHPMLVDWSELSEAERDKDREAVRDLPRMLAEAGFEVRRVGPVRVDQSP